MNDNQSSPIAATLICLGCQDALALETEAAVAAGQIAAFVAVHHDHQPSGFQLELVLSEGDVFEPTSAGALPRQRQVGTSRA